MVSLPTKLLKVVLDGLSTIYEDRDNRGADGGDEDEDDDDDGEDGEAGAGAGGGRGRAPRKSPFAAAEDYSAYLSGVLGGRTLCPSFSDGVSDRRS